MIRLGNRPVLAVSLLTTVTLSYSCCLANETERGTPLQIEVVGAPEFVSPPLLTAGQRTLLDQLYALHGQRQSIVAILQRQDLGIDRELEFVPSQVKALEEVFHRRAKDQSHDRDACAFVKTDDKREVQDFLNRIRELERKREEMATKRVRDILLPHQQVDLGKLIVKRCDFDFFSLPFAEDVLKLTPQQYARIARAQRSANKAFQEVIDKSKTGELRLNKAQLDQRMLPHTLSIMHATVEALDVEQLKTLFTLRGSLKEGQSLRQFATTLPPEFRVLLERKLDKAEKAGS